MGLITQSGDGLTLESGDILELESGPPVAASNKVRFLIDNLIDRATLTPSSEVATLPASNLQNKILKKVWRTAGVNAESLAIDFGQVESINSLALLNFNFTAGAQFTIQASNAPDFSTLLMARTFDVWEPLFGFGEGGYGEHGYGGYLADAELADYTPLAIQFFSPIEAQYWKILFDDPNNPDGFFDLGRLWMDYWLSPDANFAYGWQIYWNNYDVISRSIGGQKYTDLKAKQRVFAFNLDRLSDDEKYQLILWLQRHKGLGDDFILSLFPEKTDNRWYYTTAYGRLSKIDPAVQPNFLQSQTQIEFEESV